MTRSITRSTGIVFVVFSIIAAFTCTARCSAGETREKESLWEIAQHRSAIYADCARNVRRLLQGWIDLKQDPKTRLFSRAGGWDYHNEAADHYRA